MRGPCAAPADTQSVAVHCTLLQQLSQDLLDKAPAELNSGCDSSDCLICQGQRQFCNQAITNSVCSWLGRRSTQLGSSISSAPGTSSSQLSATVEPQSTPACVQQPQPAQVQDHVPRGQHKRLKLSPTSTPTCSAGEVSTAAQDSAADDEQQQQVQGQQGGRLSSPEQPDNAMHASSSSWQWQPHFAVLEGPAPAQLKEVARLQSAADAAAGHCAGRCDRISGLEFSVDGQLLAAAGVSKQIGLYPLASLTELQAAAEEAPDPAPGSNGSSSSSQRQQRLQQQHEQQARAVPLLQPVATVRLPGKVSSIAFSPDMQGVISIGDYDGTLTQVHVASGHYLNEVDAHAGRRIWSVCHSKLRRHFAATASDDCTARLWAGSGLNTHVATISAPGRPAVCSADFSSSDEYLLALAAADARVYLYDLRQLAAPVVTLYGHRRPVSYAKFFGSQQLVSASIDGTLAVWDLGQVLTGSGPGLTSAGSAAMDAAPSATGPSPATSTCCSSDGSCWQQQPQQQCAGAEARCSTASAAGCCTAAAAHSDSAGGEPSTAAGAAQQPQQLVQQPWKVFRGHTNVKNFVGLSVDPCSGLMAVGSESSEVFTYHTSWSSPLARFDMEPQQQQQQQGVDGIQQQLQQPTAAQWGAPPPPAAAQQSVSAVAWQPSCAAAAMQLGCGGGVHAPSTLLAAATSAGVCRLLSLQH